MTPKGTVRAYIEEMWNANDTSVFDDYVAKDVLYHPPRGPTKSYDGYRAMAESFMRAFPDLHFEITGEAQDGDLVATRLRITGTHTGGEHLGLEPTSNRVDVQGRPWFRVSEGRVVEVWSLYDERGMLEQLGAPPQAPEHSH